MSVEKSYTVNLKYAVDPNGRFQSIRVLGGRSQIPSDILETVNAVLRDALVPAEQVRTTVEIGDFAEQMVLDHLLNIGASNQDFEVDDTSAITGHGDIAIRYRGKRICVEVKNYKTRVPMKEIEKYHRSLALVEYDCGIMIQINPHGFAKEAGIRSPIDLRSQEGKPSAYMTAVDLELIYPTISLLLAHIGEPIDESEIERKRKALLAINEQVSSMRKVIEAQKRAVANLEQMVEAVAQLSLE